MTRVTIYPNYLPSIATIYIAGIRHEAKVAIVGLDTIKVELNGKTWVKKPDLNYPIELVFDESGPELIAINSQVMGYI